jgi:hypothetical protein
VEQPFHTAVFLCEQQIPGTDEEGEERERPGKRGLTDKKPVVTFVFILTP